MLRAEKNADEQEYFNNETENFAFGLCLLPLSCVRLQFFFCGKAKGYNKNLYNTGQKLRGGSLRFLLQRIACRPKACFCSDG